MRRLNLMILFSLLLSISLQSQTINKFSKKITVYLSKDEILKAEEFCEQQKTAQDRAACYVLLGDNSLNELEYSNAMKYYLKAMNKDKQYNALKAAEASGNLQLIDNLLIRIEKEKNPNIEESNMQNKAFMPIAEICYNKKDFKNAGYYYEKAGIKLLSIECKVLHAINTKDYISVVELSEKETIGLRNTMEVYKNAADQYFEKADYKNASKCYHKIGDKSNVKLCFEREKEIELKKSLAKINDGKFEFQENPLEIRKKLEIISAEIQVLEEIASSYKQNDYMTESDNLTTFTKILKRTVQESLNGCFLQKNKTADGKTILNDLWVKINEIINNKQLDFSFQKQQPLKTLLKEIDQLNRDYGLNAQTLAMEQLDKSGLNKVNTIYQAQNTIELAKKLIDDYFISINAKETPKSTSWLIYNIAKNMQFKIIQKLDDLYDSTQSESIKKKITTEKSSFLLYFKNKIKETFYLNAGFQYKTWNDYLTKEEFKETYEQIFNSEGLN